MHTCIWHQLQSLLILTFEVPARYGRPISLLQSLFDNRLSLERYSFVLQHQCQWYITPVSQKTDVKLTEVPGAEAKDAAWYYPEPLTDRAAKLKNYVAFCELAAWHYH